MSAIRTRTVTNAILPSEYEADAMHTDPHTQSSSTGTTWECVALMDTLYKVIKGTDYREVRYICKHPPRYRRKVFDPAKRSSTPARKSYSIPLGTLDPENPEEYLLVMQKFR